MLSAIWIVDSKSTRHADMMDNANFLLVSQGDGQNFWAEGNYFCLQITVWGKCYKHFGDHNLLFCCDKLVCFTVADNCIPSTENCASY